MIIKNGLIFGENGCFRPGTMQIAGGVIESIFYEENVNNALTEPRVDCIDARGLYVIPGLVDIHLHGACGYDFCDSSLEELEAVAEYERSQGVTSLVPATMTLPKDTLMRVMIKLGELSECNDVMKGITMEGPFISEGKKGAQNGCYIQKPNVTLFQELQEASGGLIRQVTVAPEIEGAVDFILEMSGETVVSLAHTEAGYETAKEAFHAGANHVTHLYNGMLPFGHREPGVVGAALENERVFVELICDGEHVHPTVIQATFKMFGAKRICMISDSMSATGMPEGEYSLGGQAVTLKGKRATLADGSLAGAVTTLYDNLKKVVLEMQISLEEAVMACTQTPARSLGLENCGVLAVGRKADVVLLDEELNIKYVIVSGKVRKTD